MKIYEVHQVTATHLTEDAVQDMVAALRGKKPSEIAPKGLIDAFEKTKAERKSKTKVIDVES